MKLIWSKHKIRIYNFKHSLYAVVHFGDIPAECSSRVLGHDQTVLSERPSEVVPHAPAIQADVRASCDRWLAPDQQQKQVSISSGIVFISFYKPLRAKSLNTNHFSNKRKVRKCTHAPVELQCTQGNTDSTALSLRRDDAVRNVHRPQCKSKVFFAHVISRRDKNVERQNGAGNDSLWRLTVADHDERSVKAPQSRRERIPRREESFPESTEE